MNRLFLGAIAFLWAIAPFAPFPRERSLFYRQAKKPGLLEKSMSLTDMLNKNPD